MPDIGRQLAEVPVGTMIEKLALGIAKAQKALDKNSVETLKAFNKEKIEIRRRKRSLIECGLLPSFYFFSEATLELRMSMSMRSESSTTVGIDAHVDGQQGGVAFGASLNFENTRKSEFSAEGSTVVNVRMVAVPPPAQLLALLEA